MKKTHTKNSKLTVCEHAMQFQSFVFVSAAWQHVRKVSMELVCSNSEHRPSVQILSVWFQRWLHLFLQELIHLKHQVYRG